MVDVTPDFKPPPSPGGIGRKKPRGRSHASAERISEIRAKKCQACRICGTTRGVNAHHLIPRGSGGSPGGLWTESNVVGLCGFGNAAGCHGLVESRDRKACSILRARLTDAEYSYVVTKRSDAWLDWRYPVEWERVA